MLPAPRSTRETERVCGECGITFRADFPCTDAATGEDVCLEHCTDGCAPLGAAS